MKYVLKRKSDGWYLATGQKHTSNPNNAIVLDDSELGEWLKLWSDHEAIPMAEAKKIEE
jgi:hypothetical protein